MRCQARHGRGQTRPDPGLALDRAGSDPFVLPLVTGLIRTEDRVRSRTLRARPRYCVRNVWRNHSPAICENLCGWTFSVPARSTRRSACGRGSRARARSPAGTDLMVMLNGGARRAPRGADRSRARAGAARLAPGWRRARARRRADLHGGGERRARRGAAGARGGVAHRGLPADPQPRHDRRQSRHGVAGRRRAAAAARRGRARRARERARDAHAAARASSSSGPSATRWTPTSWSPPSACAPRARRRRS